MVSDLDEQDLYPPDAEELTPAVRDHRNRVVVGTALVVWGTSLLVQRALGVDLDTFWLGVGLAALAGWTQVRRYPWFVAGSVATALGVGDLARGPLDGAFGSTVSLLLIAGAFAAVYVRYPRRSTWALPVAAVFTLIAVGSFGIALIGLVPAVFGRFLLPLLLIGGGVLLLLRHSLPPRTVKIGLAGLAVAFVLVGATSVPDIDHDQVGFDGPPFGGFDKVGFSQDLPLGSGDTLVLLGTSGDVEFRAADSASIQVRGEVGPGKPVAIREEPGRVVVGDNGFFGKVGSVDYVVSLPPGVEIDVERESGSISGTLAGVSGAIRTTSGDVELELKDGGAEGYLDDGPLDIETRSGSVTIDSELLLDLDLASEDDVIVNRENQNGRFRSPAGTVGVELEIDADSGDIEIDSPRPVPPAEAAEPDAPSPPAG